MRLPHCLVVLLVVTAACQGAGPELATTDQRLITTSPASSYTFPASVQVGQSSPAFTVTVSPQGINNSYDLVTSVTESCPDFSVNAPGLPAYVTRECIAEDCGGQICEPQLVIPPNCIEWYTETYQFTVTFSPVVAGATSCVVNVQTQAGQVRAISFSGTGTLPPVDIDVQPTSIAFGDVRRNTTSTPASFSVKNLGGQTLTVNSTAISAGFAFASGPTGSYTVAPGASRAYTVVCQPTAVTTMSGMITVSSNDPATPTVTVPLTCRGIDSNLDITPSPSTIPTTRVGEAMPHTITLRNSGNASMTIQSVALTGADLTMISAPSAGTTLNPGASTTAQVRFEATASGDATGMLVVTYDGGQTRTAQISARALGTSMAMTPDGTVDLGAVCVGQTKDQTFSIIANDEAAFQVDQISVPTGAFAVTAPSLPATVQGAGGSELAFTVTAAPTATGPDSATVTVTTDIPGAAPRELQVTAEGLTAGVSATPATLEFGASPIATTTLGQAVSVTNCAAGPVDLTNARIEGADAAEFSIVLPPASTTVASTEAASWLVVLSPNSTGPKQAVFSVDHPDGTVSVMLLGEGLGEGGPGPTDPDGGRPSYYACSTSGAGGSTAAWPLVLAVVLALRRRRAR